MLLQILLKLAFAMASALRLASWYTQCTFVKAIQQHSAIREILLNSWLSISFLLMSCTKVIEFVSTQMPCKFRSHASCKPSRRTQHSTSVLDKAVTFILWNPTTQLPWQSRIGHLHFQFSSSHHRIRNHQYWVWNSPVMEETIPLIRFFCHGNHNHGYTLWRKAKVVLLIVF